MANSDLQIHALSPPDQIIELLGIYMEEWRYRNSLFWHQLFLLYTSALVVFVLPYMEAPFKFDFTGTHISKVVFTAVGMILSFLFVYISLGNAFRAQSSRETYMSVALRLPENMRPVQIGSTSENKNDKHRNKRKFSFYFSPSLSKITISAMFISLIILAIVLIVWG